MVEILDKEGKTIQDPNKEKGIILSYHIDKKLIKYLDKIKNKLNLKDKDYVLLVDGYEGSGKSTFAQQIGKYVDSTLNLSRICMTADEFKEQILNANKGQCVIYDEAVTGLSSRESITRIGRLIKSLMMQMRQKNLFVIIVMPILFDLERYAVLSRAKALFHIYEKGERMGFWVGYNKKDLRKLYLKGKKTYSYRVRSRFIGRFFGKMVVNETEYKEKKGEALMETDIEEGKGGREGKYLLTIKKMCLIFKEKFKLGEKKQEILFKEYEIPLHHTIIGEYLREIRGKYNEKPITHHPYIL